MTEHNTAQTADDSQPENQPVIKPGTEAEIERLRQYQMRNWWLVCLAVWLTIGLFSLWLVRSNLAELRDYFTWVAVKYMLVYNRVAAVGFGISIGLTIALLYAESRHILWGLSISEQQQLASRLAKIREQGPSHPQWSVVRPSQAEVKE